MSKRRRKTQEVFLSHSSRNRKFAARLADVLRSHGIPVWYSETNIVGAQQWHDEIGRALDRCHWFALILSPGAVRSPWVKRELLYVLQQSRYENRIVPVLYRDCEASKLSWTLSSFQMIDFRDDVDEGFTDLLRVWGHGYDATRV